MRNAAFPEDSFELSSRCTEIMADSGAGWEDNADEFAIRDARGWTKMKSFVFEVSFSLRSKA